MELKRIAVMVNDFPTKFGLPRQGGITDSLIGKIVFDKEYSSPEAVRGLEDFSHVFIIWEFSESIREDWSPTVRPPRLGGNKRVGVFATRSPFRPNPIGLSVVKLLKICKEQGRTVLYVSGADLMDGTPIYDIKPYLPFSDSVPDAVGGFADAVKDHSLDVVIQTDGINGFSDDKRAALIEILSQDPRPSYIDDPERIYGFKYSNKEIKFKVDGNTLYLTEIV